MTTPPEITPRVGGGAAAKAPWSVGPVARRAFGRFRRVSLGIHVLALATLAIVAVIRYPHYLLASEPRLDEGYALAAFDELRAGRSPYRAEPFNYPPSFAAAGAWWLGVTGVAGVVTSMRLLNLAGMAVTAWIACAWIPVRFPLRWVIAALMIVFSPSVHHGFQVGNLSLAVAGATLLGLLVWPARPWLAWFLLAASLAVKPLALAAIPLLLVHRPSSGTGRHRRGALLALPALAAAVLLPGDFEGFLRVPEPQIVLDLSVSLRRVLSVLGLDVDRLLLATAVVGSAAALAWRRRLDRGALVMVAGVTSILAAPIVWRHSLVLLLPLQVIAVVRLFPGRLWSRRGLLVAAGILAIQLNARGDILVLPPWLQALLLVPSVAAPAALAWHAMAGEPKRSKG